MGWIQPRRPSPERKSARARPRPGGFADKSLCFRITRSRSEALFTQSLTLCKKVPRALFLRRGGSSTASRGGRTPVSAQTGRIVPRPVPRLRPNQIRDPGSIFPNIIARMVKRCALATGTVNMVASPSCSRRLGHLHSN
jgi:hypothetical protein